jgi:hypothetical protein
MAAEEIARATALLAEDHERAKAHVNELKDKRKTLEDEASMACRFIPPWVMCGTPEAAYYEAASAERRAKMAECLRELRKAEASVILTECAMVKGPTKATLAFIQSEFQRRVSDGRTPKSEAWRLRAEAVEAMLAKQLRDAQIYAYKQHYSLHAEELYSEAQKAHRLGAENEREMQKKALAREAAAAEERANKIAAKAAKDAMKICTKPSKGSAKLLMNFPMELCLNIVVFLDPKSRSLVACVNRTYRLAVNLFEETVPRELSIDAAMQTHAVAKETARIAAIQNAAAEVKAARDAVAQKIAERARRCHNRYRG